MVYLQTRPILLDNESVLQSHRHEQTKCLPAPAKAEAEWQATQSLRYMVDAVRRDHPRMGAKSLYTRLCPEHMGRDKFLIWYQENGYSVHPQKTGRTTDSSGVVRFDNLITSCS